MREAPMLDAPILALDIGGTKLAAGVVRMEDGVLLSSARAATPRTSDAGALFVVVEQVLREARAAAGDPPLQALGVGCGGPMRYPEGVVSPLNIPAWREFPLRTALEDTFGLPCVVDNDAKAMALGEWWRGAGQGTRNLLGLVVSTGVGGGIVLDGRLLHGQRGNAGHIGHVVVWPGGPPCACGARGCVEAIASGSGLARRVAAAAAEEPEAAALGDGATAADIALAARAGNRFAARLFQEAGEAVGRGIASAAALLDLELATIGGSVALRAWDLLGPPLAAELSRSARLDFTRSVRVVRAALGDSAGLIGAAALARPQPSI